MRILFLVICAFSYPFFSFSQKGLELTINNSINFSFILNQNDQQEASILSRTSIGNTSLVTVGHNFSKTLGIATGLGFTYLQQNYVQTTTAKQLKILQETSFRALTYIRLPLLFRISSSPNAPVQFFMRLGPHLDALITARGRTKYPFNSGRSDKKIDYRNQYGSTEQPLNIFNNFVFGASIDLGTKIQLSELFDLLILAHFESSLTNLEGESAPRYFPSDFRAVTPNDYILVRRHTHGLMVGLNIGLTYRLQSDSMFYQPRSRYRSRYWRAQ